VEFADVRHPGTWKKQNLMMNRKPYKPGKWLKEARFNWFKKEPNNDLAEFYLTIFYNSFESLPAKYKTATIIETQVTTTKSFEAVQEEQSGKVASFYEVGSAKIVISIQKMASD